MWSVFWVLNAYKVMLYSRFFWSEDTLLRAMAIGFLITVKKKKLSHYASRTFLKYNRSLIMLVECERILKQSYKVLSNFRKHWVAKSSSLLFHYLQLHLCFSHLLICLLFSIWLWSVYIIGIDCSFLNGGFCHLTLLLFSSF